MPSRRNNDLYCAITSFQVLLLKLLVIFSRILLHGARTPLGCIHTSAAAASQRQSAATAPLLAASLCLSTRSNSASPPTNAHRCAFCLQGHCKKWVLVNGRCSAGYGPNLAHHLMGYLEAAIKFFISLHHAVIKHRMPQLRDAGKAAGNLWSWLTLYFGSILLNMGAFLSMSGMITNLHNSPQDVITACGWG